MAENKVQSIDKRMDEHYAVATAQSDAGVQAVLNAINRLALQWENGGSQAVADLRERVALLESRPI